jgi:hypothetical protein
MLRIINSSDVASREVVIKCIQIYPDISDISHSTPVVAPRLWLMPGEISISVAPRSKALPAGRGRQCAQAEGDPQGGIDGVARVQHDLRGRWEAVGRAIVVYAYIYI